MGGAQGDAGGCRGMQGGSPESPDYRGRAPGLGPSGARGPGPAQGPAIRLIDETLHRPDPPGKGPNFSAS